MNKAFYESPEFNIVMFSVTEVITASYQEITTTEEDKPIVLPFVPFG